VALSAGFGVAVGDGQSIARAAGLSDGIGAANGNGAILLPPSEDRNVVTLGWPRNRASPDPARMAETSALPRNRATAVTPRNAATVRVAR
jgi:hypothetical protein